MPTLNCPRCGQEIKAGDQICSRCGYIFDFSTDIIADGTILQNKYRVEKLLHSGGMGYVYLALDSRLNRQVVLKQIRERVKSEAHLKKLEEEALYMAQLSHPAVAMVLDHFTENSYYYLVVEYINGKTLNQVFEEHGRRLGEAEAVKWAIETCDVISYIHKKGIVHRDISPDNIMVTGEGYIKLIDFGTMRELSSTAGKMSKEGKFGFTPPEQWKGNPVAQSDIFALAATIYYLLTDYLPLSPELLSGDKPVETDYSPDFPPIRSKNESISAELQDALQTALSIDLYSRTASIGDFEAALRSTPAGIEGEFASPGDMPHLSFAPSSADFGLKEWGQSYSTDIILKNSGGGELMGSAIVSDSWINVDPSIIQFTGFQRLTITIDTARVPPYEKSSGFIDIKSNGGDNRLPVTVTTTTGKVKDNQAGLKKSHKVRNIVIIGISGIFGLALAGVLLAALAPKPPVLSVDSPAELVFENQKITWISSTQNILISNTGGGVLTGNVTCNESWVTVLPKEINLKGTENITCAISINTFSMKYKEHKSANIIISTQAGNKTIPVSVATTNIVYEDDFGDKSRGWTSTTDVDAPITCDSGELRVVMKKSGFERYLGNNVSISADPVQYDVDCHFASSSYSDLSANYNYYGLSIGFKDIQNCLLFAIWPNSQQYFFGTVINGSMTKNVELKYSSLIKKGSSTNHLMLVCQESTIKIYINGSLVDTVYTTGNKSGGLRLIIGKGLGVYSTMTYDSDVLFDNLKVSMP